MKAQIHMPDSGLADEEVEEKYDKIEEIVWKENMYYLDQNMKYTAILSEAKNVWTTRYLIQQLSVLVIYSGFY